MSEKHNLNVTDASNTERFPEGMAPSAVNNGARALEGIIAREYYDMDGSVEATLSGSVIQMTANRVSLTLTGTTSNYIANMVMRFKMGASDNPSPCSIRINDIQTLDLRDAEGATLSASVVKSGSVALVWKDNANNYFRLLSPEARSNIAFLAYNSGNDTNQTGNNTEVTVDFDTEVFDDGNDFASDTFTAPKTGRYQLNAAVQCSNFGTGATTMIVSIVTSNRTYRVQDEGTPTTDKQYSLALSAVADMDEGDTAHVTVIVSGMASATVTVSGGSTLQTYFSGHLIQ